jgi:pyrroline-5-carboxylate reductase
MNMISKDWKIGFIGAGQMAQAMIKAFLDSGQVAKEKIFVSSRTEARLNKVVEKFGITACSSNEKLVESTDLIILATKPQDLAAATEAVAMAFDEGQIVLSVCAGFTLPKLKKLIPSAQKMGRAMMNTPVRMQKGVIGYCFTPETALYEAQLVQLLGSLGEVFPIPDGEPMQAVTVSSASGTGFVLELMQYWQDWIEGYDIDPETARRITVQTFLGTALLAEKQYQQSFEELQSHVVSKKGTTAAGLDSIRENDVERLLRLSFEKAVLRDTELSNSKN